MQIFIATLMAAFLCLSPFTADAADQNARTAKMAALQTETDAAIVRVVEIVNQPISVFTRLRDSEVGYFAKGWFHEGAIEPEFETVDIRKYQTFPYNNHPYVSSSLNPTEMFRSSELEFNAMTKYFYMDRTRPKKKLNKAEMDEINLLYRTIGKNRRLLADLKKGR
ncbi:MAG: hypothetical protein JWO78_1929 [Micavibrio sp.]|nr:hypothetical protein [Micavibrio sp.]